MTQPAVELRAMSMRFGQSEIIRDIDLAIAKGERHAIIGPNGAGKSTLFNVITGKYRPSDGEVMIHGDSVATLKPYEINRKGLSRSFQITNIFPRLTVFENVRCGLLWSSGYGYSFWHLLGRQHRLTQKTEQVLDEIGLIDRRDIPAGVLTYAEQRALEIGITIAGGADIIMLDEPTAGMSASETERAVELIRKVSTDKTLVIVEHDMGVVFDLADRISVLVYGKIIASDAPAAVRQNQDVQEAYLGTALETVE